jgi:hypothetical protein
MSDDPDADLRDLFHRLREHDHGAAPTFESMLPRASVAMPRSGRGLARAAGAGALAIAAGVFVMLQPRTVELGTIIVEAPVYAPPAWPALPTDFLLADAADSVRRLSLAPLPTADLGQAAFNPERGKQ